MAQDPDQFSEAAIACAVGWIAGRADSVVGEKLFVPRAIAALYENQGLSFKTLSELEALIRDEFIRRGIPNPPNLQMFLSRSIRAATVSQNL